MRSLYCTLLLILLLLSSVDAQEARSLWNSSTGATVSIYADAGRKPVRIRLEQAGSKPLEYQVSSTSANGFEYMAGNSKIKATYSGAGEITLKNAQGTNVFRWTRRGGKAAFPIPSAEDSERTYWRNEDRSKIFMLLCNPKEASLMVTFTSAGQKYIMSLPARWTDFPRTLQYQKPNSGSETLRFYNPMVFKHKGEFFYQSHPDFEKK